METQTHGKMDFKRYLPSVKNVPSLATSNAQEIMREKVTQIISCNDKSFGQMFNQYVCDIAQIVNKDPQHVAEYYVQNVLTGPSIIALNRVTSVISQQIQQF